MAEGTEGLRAAAERRLKHLHTVLNMRPPQESPYTYVEVSTGAAGFCPDAEQRDLVRLADHAAADIVSQPPDDEAPATPELLMRLPGAKQFGTMIRLPTATGHYLILHDDGEWWLGIDVRLWQGRTVTLGDVARLRAALEGE